MPTSKYDGCLNGFSFQLKKTGKYLDIVFETLKKIDDKDITQFALESIAIRIVSFFEELICCLIMIEAIYKESTARKYFTQYGNQNTQKQVKAECDLGTLTKFAKREISFKEGAKKFERIFNYLFGFPPFPDLETKDLVLDMILIRNIIVHEGAWPNENHAKQVKHPGAIKLTSEIKLKDSISRFYKLELIDDNFLINAIKAIQSMVFYIHRKLTLQRRL